MDIKEAKEILKNNLEKWKKDCQIMIDEENFEFIQAVETVLQELDNSISKDKIAEIIDKLKENNENEDKFTRAIEDVVIMIMEELMEV